MRARQIVVKSARAPLNSFEGPKGGSYWCSFEVLGVLVQKSPPKKLCRLRDVAFP